MPWVPPGSQHLEGIKYHFVASNLSWDPPVLCEVVQLHSYKFQQIFDLNPRDVYIYYNTKHIEVTTFLPPPKKATNSGWSVSSSCDKGIVRLVVMLWKQSFFYFIHTVLLRIWVFTIKPFMLQWYIKDIKSFVGSEILFSWLTYDIRTKGSLLLQHHINFNHAWQHWTFRVTVLTHLLWAVWFTLWQSSDEWVISVQCTSLSHGRFTECEMSL